MVSVRLREGIVSVYTLLPMTNAEILAAWILYASKAGPDGRLLPTEKEITEIVDKKPDRFEEAHALATAFVEKVSCAPDNIVSATKGFMHHVNQLQEKLGGILSSEPASKFMPKGRLRP